MASQRRRDIGRPWTRSSLAVISETTRPAPSEAASRRKGASVTPDIGASKTRLATSISPILSGLNVDTGPVTEILIFAATASLRLPRAQFCAHFLGSQVSCLHFRQFYRSCKCSAAKYAQLCGIVLFSHIGMIWAVRRRPTPGPPPRIALSRSRCRYPNGLPPSLSPPAAGFVPGPAAQSNTGRSGAER